MGDGLKIVLNNIVEMAVAFRCDMFRQGVNMIGAMVLLALIADSIEVVLHLEGR